MFGSTFDNGIVETVGYIVLFIGGIVGSRTHNIYYCLRMERLVKTIVIEYRTLTQLMAVKEILAGMPLVVVDNITDRWTYYDGY